MSQRARILAALKAAGFHGITALNLERETNVLGYRQRISDLRAAGYVIEANESRVKGVRVTTYKLVSEPSGEGEPERSDADRCGKANLVSASGNRVAPAAPSSEGSDRLFELPTETRSAITGKQAA